MPAAIVAANVSVTMTPGIFVPPGKPHECYPTINFGAADGSQTYDTNGIPMPAPGGFGMLKVIHRILFEDTPAFHFVFDPTVRAANPVAPYGTIRMYAQVGGAETSGAVAVTALKAIVIGE